MAAADAAGIIPSAACARASAASKSNIACTTARTPNTSAMAGAVRKLSNRAALTAMPLRAGTSADVNLAPPVARREQRA